MIWAVGVIVIVVLFTQWGKNRIPRPPKKVREAIARNRWTP